MIPAKFERCGDKLTYTLLVGVYCLREKQFKRNSGTFLFDKTDGFLQHLLGKNYQDLFVTDCIIYRYVDVEGLHDFCEIYVPLDKLEMLNEPLVIHENLYELAL